MFVDSIKEKKSHLMHNRATRLPSNLHPTLGVDQIQGCIIAPKKWRGGQLMKNLLLAYEKTSIFMEREKTHHWYISVQKRPQVCTLNIVRGEPGVGIHYVKYSLFFNILNKYGKIFYSIFL